MIKSFKDKPTEKVFKREQSLDFPHDITRSALRKLDVIHAATTLNELRKPPGNHLEKLKGNRKGQYSIKINDERR
jgi:proteic killer suppression protein